MTRISAKRVSEDEDPAADSRTISSLTLEGKTLELLHCPQRSSKGTIVLLHEALGSVSYWKGFPEFLAAATGHSIVAYSRIGHGNSQGPIEPRSLDYYRKQVNVILPAVLEHFAIEQPILYGHSEGAGIAMLYAATTPGVRAIVAECPIVASEPQMRRTIRQLEASYAASDMSKRLGRYHADPDEVFYSWIRSDHASFSRDFPVENYLTAIECPVLVMQGSCDEFGGATQYQAIQRSLPQAQYVLFRAGHLLHFEMPAFVASTVTNFLKRLPRSISTSGQPSQR